MSGNVNAVVVGTHRVHHEFDGQPVVHTAADGVVKMTKEAFDDVAKFGAVRKATAEDRDPEVAVAGEPPAVQSVEERAAGIAEDNKAEDASKGRRG